eukprot:gene1801-53735_t
MGVCVSKKYPTKGSPEIYCLDNASFIPWIGRSVNLNKNIPGSFAGSRVTAAQGEMWSSTDVAPSPILFAHDIPDHLLPPNVLRTPIVDKVEGRAIDAISKRAATFVPCYSCRLPRPTVGAPWIEDIKKGTKGSLGVGLDASTMTVSANVKASHNATQGPGEHVFQITVLKELWEGGILTLTAHLKTDAETSKRIGAELEAALVQRWSDSVDITREPLAREKGFLTITRVRLTPLSWTTATSQLLDVSLPQPPVTVQQLLDDVRIGHCFPAGAEL